MKFRYLVIGAAAVAAMSLAACGEATSSSAPAPSKPATAQPAQPKQATPAPDNGKMTSAKFNQIQTGMTLVQVQQIAGSHGTLQTTNTTPNYPSGTITTTMYQWDGDKFGSSVSVMFQDNAVESKTQFGLEGTG